MVLSLKRPTHGFNGFDISEPFFMLLCMARAQAVIALSSSA